MTTEKAKPGADLFDQAMRNYDQAFKAGIKAQEEAAKYWTGLFSKTPTMDAWQKKAGTIVGDAYPAMQKLMEESLRVVEQCSRSSLELFKEGMETARSTSVAEGQTRLQKLWEGSLQTLQSNVQAVAQLNTRWMENCLEFARKGADMVEAAQP